MYCAFSFKMMNKTDAVEGHIAGKQKMCTS